MFFNSSESYITNVLLFIVYHRIPLRKPFQYLENNSKRKANPTDKCQHGIQDKYICIHSSLLLYSSIYLIFSLCCQQQIQQNLHEILAQYSKQKTKILPLYSSRTFTIPCNMVQTLPCPIKKKLGEGRIIAKIALKHIGSKKALIQ